MNKWYIVVLIIIAIVLLSPLVVVLNLYGNQIEFVSYQFVGDYLKFIGSLISISFSFFLINIFWKNKEAGDALNQARSILINYALRIINTADKIVELLNISFNETEFFESEKRDIEVSRLLEKIRRVGIAIENTPVDSRALKDNTFMAVYIELVWKDLLSTVERLSPTKNFRNNYDDFYSTLVEIKTIAQTINKELT